MRNFLEWIIYTIIIISIICAFCLMARADTLRPTSDIESHIGEKVNILYQVCQFCHNPYGIKHENIQDSIAGKDSHGACSKCTTELLKSEYSYLVRCTECLTFIGFKPAPNMEEHLAESGELCTPCLEKGMAELEALQKKNLADKAGYYYSIKDLDATTGEVVDERKDTDL